MGILPRSRATSQRRTGATNHVTPAELAAHGITVEELRRRAPWAIEYVALDGTPCWRSEDLEELLPEEEIP
jgi:hypothetical protein